MSKAAKNTVRRGLSAVLLSLAACLCQAGEASQSAPTLADNAPTRYVVLPGDTLWSIANVFLKEPWRWPELWKINQQQLKSPHRIFPGEILLLERAADGTPYLNKASRDTKVQPQIYSEDIGHAIPSIPPNVINPFLSEPLIIEADGHAAAARIVATQQDRVFLVSGDLAYVTQADAQQQKWKIYRKGVPLRDPETKEVLGYEAYYLGTAEQQQAGDPAIFKITSAKEEIGRGDHLLPATPPPLLNLVPHKPDQAIDARIVSVYGGVNGAGRFSVISLNKGSADKIEVGHVLALLRKRFIVQRNDADVKETIRVPDERYGLAFVFRIFEHISYALIVQSDGPASVNDHLQTP
ncbi:MAG: LysM domain-containing protein [Pseudomonadota bacterium]